MEDNFFYFFIFELIHIIPVKNFKLTKSQFKINLKIIEFYGKLMEV